MEKGQFESAAKDVQNLTKRPSNEELLALYALYKQATEGDVKGSRPGMLDFKGRAKYDAWAKQKGRNTQEVQQEYVSLVDSLKKKYL
jgi:acyl-CoA-binding protein